MKLKTVLLFNLILLLICHSNAQKFGGGGEAYPKLKTNQVALKKFQDNRFGMFIHWGPVTLRGTEIGWSRGTQVKKEEYDNLYKEFNPILFDAKEWVNIAKNAGMKYMILTTRHHDGFSLWDSKYSDYDMANSAYGKGVVKDLANECKKQGIDFGIYYTILDWWHPDYPKTRTKNNPSPTKINEKDIDPEVWKKMERFNIYIKNQLKELIELTDPSIIWLDGQWEWPWTHKMGMDLYAYIKNIKDDLIINDRVDKSRTGMSGTALSKKFAGDFSTPEQQVGNFNNKNAWESCITIGKQWAWKPNDKMKSKKECIQTLIQTVGGDGNLLFNVGPMADGRIEQRQIDRLKEMGDWLTTNGEAVYGTRGGPYKPADYMVSTHKGNKIYLHLFKKPKGKFILPFTKGIKIEKVYTLDGNKAINFNQYKESIQIQLPEVLADDINTVIVLELNKKATDVGIIDRLRY